MNRKESILDRSWLTVLLSGLVLSGSASAVGPSVTENTPIADLGMENQVTCANLPTIRLARAGDLDKDGAVGRQDIALLRSKFFTGDVEADLNTDGVVDFSDLQIILTHIGRVDSICTDDAADGVVFEVSVAPYTADRFYIFLSDPEMIEYARAMLNGAETVDTARHISGVVRVGHSSYNSDWSFYLEPSSISFFDNEIAACNATISHVDANSDAWCSMVSGCRWCPWESEIIREIN